MANSQERHDVSISSYLLFTNISSLPWEIGHDATIRGKRQSHEDNYPLVETMKRDITLLRDMLVIESIPCNICALS